MDPSLETPLVTVTLDRLLHALPETVRVLHPGRGDSAVRWVGPSELDDPVPFLVPGEVVGRSLSTFFDTARKVQMPRKNDSARFSRNTDWMKRFR